MKKQNLIIIVIFVIAVFIFYLFSCNEKNEVINVSSINSKNDLVVVNVSGEVYRAGKYEISKTWTIKMLFEYVGVKDTADLSGFDLLGNVESRNYYIPKIVHTKEEDSKKVNINKASKEELMTLQGIGESIAGRIISYREKNPFKSIEELKNVSGIGEKLYEKIKDFITV